jgi:hypothetical protein
VERGGRDHAGSGLRPARHVPHEAADGRLLGPPLVVAVCRLHRQRGDRGLLDPPHLLAAPARRHRPTPPRATAPLLHDLLRSARRLSAHRTRQVLHHGSHSAPPTAYHSMHSSHCLLTAGAVRCVCCRCTSTLISQLFSGHVSILTSSIFYIELLLLCACGGLWGFKLTEVRDDPCYIPSPARRPRAASLGSRTHADYKQTASTALFRAPRASRVRAVGASPPRARSASPSPASARLCAVPVCAAARQCLAQYEPHHSLLPSPVPSVWLRSAWPCTSRS